MALFHLAVLPAISGERSTLIAHAAVVLLHAAPCAGRHEMLGRTITRRCGTGSDTVVSRRLLHACALVLMGFGLGLVASAWTRSIG